MFRVKKSSGWEKFAGNSTFLPTIKKKSKFFSKRVKKGERPDGLSFDSKDEATHYDKLVHRQALGLISGLRRQVTFVLDVNGVRISSYRADYVYYDVEAKQDVVEDFKSAYLLKIDRAFAMKRKLMKALYGIDVNVVTKKN